MHGQQINKARDRSEAHMLQRQANQMHACKSEWALLVSAHRLDHQSGRPSLAILFYFILFVLRPHQSSEIGRLISC